MAVQFIDNPLVSAFQDAFGRAYSQGAGSAQQTKIFKLSKAAQREEFDYENNAKQNNDVTKRVKALAAFNQIYPEYADQATKAGRPLSAGEISDFRETARATEKTTAAKDAHDKLAAYVATNGDQADKDYFAATGKLHPKMTAVGSHTTVDPKKQALADLDQQLKAYTQDMTYASQRKKASSYDPKAEQKDMEAAASAGKLKGYQSNYRRSDTVGEARAGSEHDYWNAVNDMMAAQARIQAVANKRLALTGGSDIPQSTAGVFQPPPPVVTGPIATGQPGAQPITGQPGQPMPGSTPMPGAPIQQQPITAEQAKNHALYSAAKLKIAPARIATFRAPTMQEAAAVKAAVMRQYSDPNAQRQAFYDILVQGGVDPTKLPVPDAPPAVGTPTQGTP